MEEARKKMKKKEEETNFLLHLKTRKEATINIDTIIHKRNTIHQLYVHHLFTTEKGSIHTSLGSLFLPFFFFFVSFLLFLLILIFLS